MRKEKRGLIMVMALGMLLCGCAQDATEGSRGAQEGTQGTGTQENSGSDMGSPENETKDETKDQQASGESEELGFPISPEMIDVTGMAWVSPQGGDNTDNYGWDRYREMTNINVQWENVPNDILEERKSTVMTSNSLPDVFFALGFSNSDLTRYGSQGVFLALDDLIDQYGYNFKKLMEEYPEIRRGITMPDGHIYGMPTLKMGDNMRIMKMYVNEDWLKNLDLSYPETLDEFTEMLRAFKEQDANGNGDASDEIPLAFRTSHLIPTMMSLFDLGTRGDITHTLVDYDEDAKALRFMPTSPQYKEMLAYLNMLYEEKLLDNEVYSMPSSRDMVAKLTQNIVGVHADYTTNAGDLQDKFLAMPVFENYYGNKVWNRVLPLVETPGAFVISAGCKYPGEMMRWIDYFYGEEGQLMSNMGFEGVTFEYDENGEVKYTEELLNNSDGLTLTQVRAQYMNFHTGAGIRSDEYYKGAETYWTSTEGLKYYIDYIPKEVWPAFNYTYDENEEISALETDIASYVNEKTAAFITGRESLENWDKYVQEFERLDLSRYMELVEAGYARYSSN